MTGIELIAKERQEQIEKHGRTLEKDKEINKSQELVRVAEVLLFWRFPKIPHFSQVIGLPKGWDTDIYLKMVEKPYKDRLIIAGALIAAELDRLNEL